MQLSLFDHVAPGTGIEVASARVPRWVRLDLGRGAWIEVVRGFAPDHRGLFQQLLECADWELHERQMYDRVVAVPRRVAGLPGRVSPGQLGRAWYGDAQVRVAEHRASPQAVERAAERLRRIGSTLSQRYGRLLPSVTLAHYRDGSDSVAFHGDKLGALREDTVVAVLSLGCARRFLLRRAPSALGSGDSGALPEALLRSGIGRVLRGNSSSRGTPGVRQVNRAYAIAAGEGDLIVMGGNCQNTWEHAVPKQPGAGPRIAVMFRESVDRAPPSA